MGRVGLPEKGRVVPKPKKDDICLCFNCAAMLRFNADEETVHTVTKEELASLDSDTLYYVLHEQATLKAFAMKRKIDLAAKQKAELN
jgi:hypothetical protein